MIQFLYFLVSLLCLQGRVFERLHLGNEMQAYTPNTVVDVNGTLESPVRLKLPHGDHILGAECKNVLIGN